MANRWTEALRWAALLLLVLAWPLVAIAQDLVAVPALHARVTDLTGTLSSEQARNLEQQLAQFEKARGSQIAILLVPTTQPEPIEQYSIRVAEAWRLGRRNVDDGVLLIVAKNDRKLRIEVGRGLEGAIPDAVAKRIIAEVITPRFKAGDFYGGLNAAAARIQALIAGEQLPVPSASDGRRAQGFGEQIETLLVVGLVVATLLGGMLSAVLGRLVGGLATGGVVGFIAMLITGSLFAAAVAAVLVFIFVLAIGGRGGFGGTRGGGWGGGWSNGTGGGGWGGSSDSGWSGGGGDFGGGGASGDW
jgi:uncharacterized protein